MCVFTVTYDICMGIYIHALYIHPMHCKKHDYILRQMGGVQAKLRLRPA